MQVELGFGNSVVDDIFFASGYDIRGFVVAQVNTFVFQLSIYIQIFLESILEAKYFNFSTSNMCLD